MQQHSPSITRNLSILNLFVTLILASCAGAAVPAAEAVPPAVTILPGQAIPTAQPTATSRPTATVAPPAATAARVDEPTAATPAAAQAEPAPYPPEHYITGIYGHKQFFSLGCEAAVAKDWAAFFGVEINEFNFQYELPKSDNPDKGFVGSVDGPWGQVPPYAYGVHAGPVADLLRQYGVPATGYRGLTVEQIKAELAAGQPVIAWVIGNVVGGVPAEYTDQAGDTVIVAAYEHVVLVTGYSETHLRYNSNGKFYDVPVEIFENSWGVLGNMAILYD